MERVGQRGDNRCGDASMTTFGEWVLMFTVTGDEDYVRKRYGWLVDICEADPGVNLSEAQIVEVERA
jgi:hypothetical protein